MLTPSETRAREARERPIIFSGPMVKAILAGRKTQTRRIIKAPRGVDPDHWMCDAPGMLGAGIYGNQVKVLHWPSDNAEHAFARLPCAKGDRLWVRETWCHTGTGVWSVGDVDRALDGKVIFRADDDGRDPGIKWFSPLFLPRWASRLTLEVTEVRVERLQDISREDAIAEGCIVVRDACNVFEGTGYHKAGLCHSSPVTAFGIAWDEIHGPDAFEANPWVAAITFRPLPASLESQKEGAAV